MTRMDPQDQTDSVAVVIAAYRAEQTIAKAVRSALAEPEVAEVFVVDDASGDQTAAVARSCDDGSGRLQVLAMAENSGPGPARNLAFGLAQSAWVTVLDADDYLLPGRFARLLKLRDEADLIADKLIRYRPADADAPNVRSSSADVPAWITLESFLYPNLGPDKDRLDFGFLKPLMRRAFMTRHNLSYAPMRLGEDFDLYARALTAGARMALTSAAGYVSVVTPGSLSQSHSIESLVQLRDSTLKLPDIRPLTRPEELARRNHWLSVECRVQWRNLIVAVKQRRPSAMARCFTSLPVSLYLLAKLSGEVKLRTANATRTRAYAQSKPEATRP